MIVFVLLWTCPNMFFRQIYSQIYERVFAEIYFHIDYHVEHVFMMKTLLNSEKKLSKQVVY